MKEIMQMMRENPKETLISTAILGLIVLGLLKAESTNQLTDAKNFMADKNRITEKCGIDTTYCTLNTVFICDGNNTIFDLTDDICEDITYFAVPYSR